jgi:hypothetical protein
MLIKRHVFCFNPQDNGGEQLHLITEFFESDNGDIYSNKEMSLQSYCNSASFNLSGAAISSETFFKLARELAAIELELSIKSKLNILNIKEGE